MNKQISVIFKFENIIFSDTKQKLIFLCFMRFRSFLKSLVVKGVVPPPLLVIRLLKKLYVCSLLNHFTVSYMSSHTSHERARLHVKKPSQSSTLVNYELLIVSLYVV